MDGVSSKRQDGSEVGTARKGKYYRLRLFRADNGSLTAEVEILLLPKGVFDARSCIKAVQTAEDLLVKGFRLVDSADCCLVLEKDHVHGVEEATLLLERLE